MKKSIGLFIIFLITNIAVIQAQQLRPNSINKASHISYKTDSAKFGHMEVYNQANTLHNRLPKTISQNVYFGKNDNLSLLNSFKQVFSTARLTQLETEPGIMIIFKLSATGKILEISFHVKENTLITVAELEGLENAIKKNVTFKLLSGKTKGGDFFVIGQNVLFKKVVDDTLDTNSPK